jgi:hypothetical protein
MKIRYGVGMLLLVLTTGCGQSSSPVMPGSSCSYALSPDAQGVPISGGTFAATMTTTTACDWTAAADVPWIAITSGSSGIMTGAIVYSLPVNTGLIRRGTISVHPAGRPSVTVTVIQEGTNY